MYLFVCRVSSLNDHYMLRRMLRMSVFCALSSLPFACSFFFFKNPAPPELSPLPHPAPLRIGGPPPPQGRCPFGDRLAARRSNRQGAEAGPEEEFVVRQAGRNRRAASQGDRLPCRARRGHRSEEHTSELQSPCNLVCRLLL